MPVVAEELISKFDELVMVTLRVLPHVPVHAIGRQMISNTLGIMLIPRVEVAFYELGRLHTAPLDLV